MKRIFIFCLAMFIAAKLFAQASFTAPDTVCINQPISIANTSTGVSTYFWNYCGTDIYSTPKITNMGNIQNILFTPSFMCLAQDGDNYYGFVSNYGNARLFRLNFGTSLLNTPTIDDLGTFGGIVPLYTQGAQAVKDADGWHVLECGGLGESMARIIKIDFGSSLGNAPQSWVNWGNIGTLNFPSELNVFQENGIWYGLTVNSQSNTVTRLTFGTSFANPPTGENLGNVTGTLNWPTGVYRMMDNGNLYFFIANTYTQSIVKMAFGNSITNTPVSTDLGNASDKLADPRDIVMINECGNLYGLVVNHTTNDLVKVSFPDGVNSTSITGEVVANSGFDFPVCMTPLIRQDSSLVGIITSAADNSLARIQFDACGNPHQPTSSLETAVSPITFSTPGVNKIQLLTDVDLPTQTSYCKDVVVLAYPKPDLGKDTSLCGGNTITLDAGLYRSYLWSTGQTTRIINVNTSGDYSVTVSNGYCTGSDTISVSGNAALDISTSVVTNIDCGVEWGQLEVMPTGGIYPYTYYMDGVYKGDDSLYRKLNPGTYTVTVIDSVGCKTSGDFTVIEHTDRIIRATASGTLPTCYDATDGAITVQVNKGVAPFEYWIAGKENTKQSNPVFTGLTKGDYKIYISNAVCMDSVFIALSVPTALKAEVTVTDELCERGNGSVVLVATGGTSPYKYYWENVLMTSNPMNDLSAGTYAVRITDAHDCAWDTTLNVLDVITLPVTIWNRDTTINIGESVTLKAANAVDYVWTPADGLSCVDCASPVAYPGETTTYVVSTLTGNNCVAADSVTVTVTYNKHIFIPTAFTPNGDGQNDVFRVKGKGIAYFQMSVYNRNGNLVFQSRDINQGWDGRLKDGLLPMGTYVYMIQFGYYGEENKVNMEKGVVTLIR